jgi:signal transduction histidine kinase/CheY-like chemotaxis protein/HAMP domain-containing protein
MKPIRDKGTNYFKHQFTILRNLTIGTQLKLGLTVLFILMLFLGLLSFQQTNKIYKQIEIMYQHPLQTRKFINELQSSFYSIRIEMKNLFLVNLLQKKEKESQQMKFTISMEILNDKFLDEINQLRKVYLGPPKDIDNLEEGYLKWKFKKNEIINLLMIDQTKQVTEQFILIGMEGNQAQETLKMLDKINNYAINKSNELYNNSNKLKEQLTKQLLLLTFLFACFSLFIINFLLRSVRTPIKELLEATKRFHEGDISSRCSYALENEFGELSNSFNLLASDIQSNLSLNKKIENISVLMLSEDNPKLFFQKTLLTISEFTNSQIAAIYLLNADNNSYDHFESIGLDSNAKQSFMANNFEGEFGPAISSRKIQHITNISEDTRFAFHTVSGKFIPREILTIPIHANNGVIAIISLASLDVYSKESITLIDEILITLCARIEGILGYKKIKEFAEKLEHQNTELEASKTELSSQSAELTEQNAELELQKKQLLQANQLKTVFFSNMSHELRTPLNSVIALSGVLYKRLANKISEEEYSYLEIIKRNGQNLLSLINDILDIARIEAGHEYVELTKFNSKELIDDIINSIEIQASQKGIQLIHSNIDPNLFIISDIKKCRHILQNIISNAVKFTEKGKVEVTAKNNDIGIEITVTDTGIGISEEQITFIFDEFKQADSSTSRKFGGNGLGLSIARKYTNMLGGSITIKSEVGKGSEFTITLPLQCADENKVVEKETSSFSQQNITQNSLKQAHNNHKKTILLVDNSEPALIQMKDILEESGYHVLLAHNGEEALTIINHTVPDALILDLMMPDIDGFQVLKSIREQEPTSHLPVLILSAKHITKEELNFLKSNNIRQLIQKGNVNLEEMLGAVANMLFPEIEELKKIQPEIKPIIGKPVVLIVEDNPDNMQSSKALLSNDFTVLEAVNGTKAIELAKKFKPNLILMDIALPGMDGIETFKKIRNNPELQNIKVIALTASAMTQDRETVLAHGFDAFIPKPIDELEFFDTINRTLYGKS